MKTLRSSLLALPFLLFCSRAELVLGQPENSSTELQKEIEDAWIRLASDIGQQEGHILARNPDRPGPPTRVHFQFMGDLQKLTIDSPTAPKTIFVGNDRSFFRVAPLLGNSSSYEVIQHHDLDEKRGLGPKLAMQSRAIWAPVSVDSIRLDELAKNGVKPKSISESENNKVQLDYSLPGNFLATFRVVVSRGNRFGVVEWELNIGDQIRRLGKVEYGTSLGGGFPNTVEIRESINGREGLTTSRYELDAPRLCTAEKSEFYEAHFGIPELDNPKVSMPIIGPRSWLALRLALLALLFGVGAMIWLRPKRS